MNKTYLIILLLLFQNLLAAQTISENWVPVSIEKEGSIFINVSGLSSFTGDEIYVWALQEFNSPMTMEEVDGKIYKVKTYYLINKQLIRYSILQIVYYDSKNNVIKHYTYEHKSDNGQFKYNYPILKNSDAEKILSMCLEYISKPAEKK